MSSDQPYVPHESSIREAWQLYGVGDTFSENEAELDRFLARVRRDAAREALDGLADEYEYDVPVFRIAHYRDAHYPEEPTE